MSWLNKNIIYLSRTSEIIEFTVSNNLFLEVKDDFLFIYNSNVLIKMYEELGYFHSDFYDLVNLRWARELDHSLINNKIIPLAEAKGIYNKHLLNNEDGELSKKTIASCFTRIELIGKYMSEFLVGKFSKYDEFLEDVKQIEQRKKIITFISEH